MCLHVPFLWRSLQFLVRVFPFLSLMLCYFLFSCWDTDILYILYLYSSKIMDRFLCEKHVNGFLSISLTSHLSCTLCFDIFIFSLLQGEILLVYIKMEDPNDFVTWLQVAKVRKLYCVM
jgi:hypothetical protein